MQLDIVIPTLDEEQQLALHLPAAVALADRVVVSDGGSTDATRQVAADHGVRFVTGSVGRGAQLRRGVEAMLDGEPTDVPEAERVLLFLHADTRLPEDARRHVKSALRTGAVGGGFRLEYDNPRPIYRLAARLIHRRTRMTRCPLGDQAQFVRLDVWHRLGGMKSWPILEDVDFARRLKRHGEVVVIESPVLASARRFESQGIVRAVVVDWLIWALYFVGLSPFRLARLYRKVG